MDGRHRVAQAWAAGHSASQGNVSTNGLDVYSYGHVVGHTSPQGKKVAYCCHYSVTTAKHCSAFKAVADRVQSCTTNETTTCPCWSASCTCCKSSVVGSVTVYEPVADARCDEPFYGDYLDDMPTHRATSGREV